MKPKLTIALMAILTSSAFAAIPKVLPEFKNEKQLAEWRDEMAAKAESETSTSDVRCSTLDVPSAFYTGKPYIESTGSYAFKYRSYDPGLARWTSEDPSGFPDGANSHIYCANPIAELDYQGLLVVAQYSITKRILTIDGKNYKDCNSGNNDFDKRFQALGPIPTGKYGIFSRDHGAATYNGHPAFILDPIDGTLYNDIWDSGQADQRYSFRIHTNVATTGCIATASIDAISVQLLATERGTNRTITQKAPIDDPRDFVNEWHLGTLTVVE